METPPSSYWPWLVLGSAATVAAVGLKARAINRSIRVGGPQPLPARTPFILPHPATHDTQHFSTTIRLPPTVISDPAGLPRAFARAFYSHPYFAVEGWAARRWGWAAMPRPPGLSLAEVARHLPPSPPSGAVTPGTSLVGGMFTVLERQRESVLLYWSTPERMLRGRTDAVAGGTHQLAVTRGPGADGQIGHELQLSLVTTHFSLGGSIRPSSQRMLEWDSKYLLYSAARRMERWAKDGRLKLE